MKSNLALISVVTLFTAVSTAYGSQPCMELEPALAAAGGDRGGNAGDGASTLFRAKADEILQWVKRNRLKNIDTGAQDPEALTEKLLTQKWRVCMIPAEYVLVNGRQKTCRNSFDPAQPDLIECSGPAFLEKETEITRYPLIAHELLGVAGVENNHGKESDDFISRQVVKFVKTEMMTSLSDEMLIPHDSGFDSNVYDSIFMDQLPEVTGTFILNRDVVTVRYEWGGSSAKLNSHCRIYGRERGKIISKGAYPIVSVNTERLSWGSIGGFLYLENGTHVLCERGITPSDRLIKVKKMKRFLGNAGSFTLVPRRD